MADDGYRGFRADRIDRIVDAETGQVIDRNILDWLIRTAERRQERRQAPQGSRLQRAARDGRTPGATTGVATDRAASLERASWT